MKKLFTVAGLLGAGLLGAGLGQGCGAAGAAGAGGGAACDCPGAEVAVETCDPLDPVSGGASHKFPGKTANELAGVSVAIYNNDKKTLHQHYQVEVVTIADGLVSVRCGTVGMDGSAADTPRAVFTLR